MPARIEAVGEDGLLNQTINIYVNDENKMNENNGTTTQLPSLLGDKPLFTTSSEVVVEVGKSVYGLIGMGLGGVLVILLIMQLFRK